MRKTLVLLNDLPVSFKKKSNEDLLTLNRKYGITRMDHPTVIKLKKNGQELLPPTKRKFSFKQAYYYFIVQLGKVQ